MECAADILKEKYATEIAGKRIWIQLELDGNFVGGEPDAIECRAARMEKDGSVSLFTVVIRNLEPGLWTIEEILGNPQRCGFFLQMLLLQKKRMKV